MSIPIDSIRFTTPAANPGRYSRRGFFHYFPGLPVHFRAVTGSGNPARARIILMQGLEQSVIAAGPWSDGPDYDLLFEEFPVEFDPLEPLVISAEPEAPHSDVWPMARPIAIGPAPPFDAPRWVATAAQPLRSGLLSYGGVGYVWWPGHRPQVSSTPYAHRPCDPWPEDLDPSKIYVQRMTPAGADSSFYGEFVMHESGHIGAHFGETMYRSHLQTAPSGLRTGLFRDGPRDVGSVSYPVSGFVDPDGAAIICSGPGRIARVDLTGAVETISGWRLPDDALAPIGIDRIPSQYEYIGDVPEAQRWTAIWDVAADPDDPASLYVANTDGQCITHVDRDTGRQTVLVGSAEGLAGYTDATGERARFHNPRGVTVKDGVLYVGDALNHAIRMVDIETREVTTLVRTADFDQHAAVHAGGSFESVREWCRDGEFGAARFMHPLHLRFAPDGALLVVFHHQAQVVEFDLETRRTTTLCDIPTANWSDQMRTWQTMSVSPVDGKIYTTGWQAGTDAVFHRDGSPFYGMHWRKGNNSVMNDARPIHSTHYDGLASHVQKGGYPQFAIAGADGSVWFGSTAGFGIHRLTPAREGDPPPPDYARAARGRDIWARPLHPHRPALSLKHGLYGMNGYGFEGVDDFGAMDFAGFRDYVRHEHQITAEEIADEELRDAHYHFKNDSITWKGFALDGAPAPEEPEPEPEPEPIVDEDLEEVRAGIQEARAGLDRMEAGLTAMVERLT